MAWKPANKTQTQPQTSQQRQAAAQQPVELTNEDVERMIEAIPDSAPVAAAVAKVEQTVLASAEVVPGALVPAIKPAPTTIPTDDEIANLIAGLSPTQLTKARLQMNIPAGGGLRRLPGGGIEVTIKLSVDLVAPLESWAEAAGKTLESQIQELAETSLSSFIFQDWGMVVPAAVPVPVTAPAVAAAPPPAAE